jgi:hypothetical protein
MLNMSNSTYNDERGIISEVLIDDAAYSNPSFESEWFPADIYNSFETQLLVDVQALFGLEFSNDKSTITFSKSERSVPSSLSRVSCACRGGRFVRFFIRELGRYDAFLPVTPPPYDLKQWGYFHKEINRESNRIEELSYWGDPNDFDYTGPWYHMDKIALLTIQAICNFNFEVYIDYSNDGNIITKTDAFLGNPLNVSICVKSKICDRYARLRISTISSSPQWRVNTFFFDNLTVDLEDVTLASAGGTSLVSDGAGPELEIKGLSAGTNVTIVDNGTDLEINAAAAASTVWQQVGTRIEPQTNVTELLAAGDKTTNVVTSTGGFVIGGDSNNCGANTDNFIIAGQSCTVTDGSRQSGIVNSANTVVDLRLSNANQYTALSCINSDITTGGGGARGAGILGASYGCTFNPGLASYGHGLLCSRDTAFTTGRRSAQAVIACIDCDLDHDEASATIASDNCTVSVANGNQSSVLIGGQNCTLDWNRGTSYGVICSSDCVFTETGGQASGNNVVMMATDGSLMDDLSFFIQNSAIIGGENHTIQHAGRVYNSLILGGQNHTLLPTNTSYNNVIIGGDDHLMSNPGGGNLIRNTIIGGENGIITGDFDDVWMFTHGAPLSATASGQFLIKNSGGTIIHSNDAANRGVSLLPNRAGWVSRGPTPGFSGSGFIDGASTDNAGRVNSIGAGSSCTITFNTSFPVGYLVNVSLTQIGAPATAGRNPYLTAVSTLNFTINNPDTGSMSVSYMVMGSV